MREFASLLWMVFYIGIFTPFAAAYRLFWQDPLRLQRNLSVKSYWQDRSDHRFRPMTSRY